MSAITTQPHAHKLLPDNDGQPVRNSVETYQSAVLTESLTPVLDALHPERDYFLGQDNGIYWRRTDPPLSGCKSPDWYLVEGVPHLLGGEMRRSYVKYEELVSPLLVAEYVSRDGTEERDKTPWEGKFWVYERMIQASYYVIYEPGQGTVEMFQRVGSRYRRMTANEQGRYPIPELGVELGIWQGTFSGYEISWLRAWDAQGKLLPTRDERAEQERERAEQERERAERLAAKLRELGVDPQSL